MMMTMKPTKARRARGATIAMVLVVLFLVLFLGLWGQAARQIGSMIRIEEARARRVRRDAASSSAREALSRALAAAGGRIPSVDPVHVRPGHNSDGSAFAVSYQRDPALPDQWIVSVEPTADSSLAPFDVSQFGPATPP